MILQKLHRKLQIEQHELQLKTQNELWESLTKLSGIIFLIYLADIKLIRSVSAIRYKTFICRMLTKS
jgi:hypothetical protein